MQVIMSNNHLFLLHTEVFVVSHVINYIYCIIHNSLFYLEKIIITMESFMKVHAFRSIKQNPCIHSSSIKLTINKQFSSIMNVIVGLLARVKRFTVKFYLSRWYLFIVFKFIYLTNEETNP